ncbi:septum site-determining protein Ssd [Corynebacterium atrinae]|uniref:septum site-determining protein Ssd n=1 Tax=Corynebacterium atrinae TaxID=1336740 RepID=UPI0025B4E44A|nr:septum site-determining protein Ssd [Corynebacterium atrinae]
MKELILVAVGDPVLHPEATHVAAATGYPLVDSVDPREISRLHSRARAIFVDSVTAPHLASLPRRESVYFLASDPGPIDWQAALSCHAEQALVLPAQAPELLRELGHMSTPRTTTASRSPRQSDYASGKIIAIVGAAGGAGTSTLAAAVARRARRCDVEVTVVDGCPNSGGLDLLVGVEETPGARWPDLGLGEGAVSAADLRAALPATSDGIAILSAARSTVADPFKLNAESFLPVVESLRAGSGLTVLDLPHGADHTVFEACDLVVLLVPAEVRPAAAAASLAKDLRLTRTGIVLLARHRAWSGLSAEDLEKLTGCEVIAELGTISRLARTVELSGLPSHLPRPLAAAADAVLIEAGY